MKNYKIMEFEGYRFIKSEKLEENGLLNLFTTADMDWFVKDETVTKKYLHTINDYFKISSHVRTNQIHANFIGVADDVKGEDCVMTFCDGVITKKNDKILSTSFSDCVPVILYDPINHAQATLHSGWKGTLLKISAEGVKMMTRLYNSRPETLLSVIGPCIGFDDFEVKDDVKDLFTYKFTDYPEIIKSGKNFFNIDLVSAVRFTLVESGLKKENITAFNLSTISNPDLLHSYRRDKQDFGMMRVFSKLK